MKKQEFSKTVILADGEFPGHKIPLGILKNASRIICCDGATQTLVKTGREPFAIVGDCDSVDESLQARFSDRIFRIVEQETNDLTKAVNWCAERGMDDLVILGGTGKREDHTLGNISLLADYARKAKIVMVTDYGIFYPVLESRYFNSSGGQQISIFSLNPETEIISSGLRYPLVKMKLQSWWRATLNEAKGKRFSLYFEGGPLIVFIAWPSSPSPG